MRHLVFIGPLGGGYVPTNGASVKNYYLLKRLKQYYDSTMIVDTEHWKKDPFVVIRLLLAVLCYRNSVYVLSTSSMTAYRFLNFLSRFRIKRKIYYWVIGGSLPRLIAERRVKIEPYQNVDKIIVEGNSMLNDLMSFHLNNVFCLPNFKIIPPLPTKTSQSSYPRKFLFLSRILPDKGCDYIFEAVRKLNLECKDRFVVDFYGKIEYDYQYLFNKQVASLPNVSYKGFLDLRDVKNYELLSDYDAFLFPTYWSGEGFPGVIIDAYIAGLPIIATDWNLNKDIIKEGLTGFLIFPHDVLSLMDAMSKFINMDESDLFAMCAHCQKEASNYDIDNVLSEECLKSIGLI